MIPYKFVNANAGTIAVTNTATSLKDLLDTAAGASNLLPSVVDGVDFVVEDGSIRVAYANDPSSTKGLLLQQGKVYSFRGVDFSYLKMIRIGSTDVVMSVLVGQSEAGESSNVFGGGTILGDNTDLSFGGVAKFRWDITDANANMFKLGLPSGGAVDVPVFAIGIASTILGIDNAVLNGTTEPKLAIFDALATRVMSVGWDGTFFRFDTGGSTQQFFFNRAVSFSSSLVMGNNAGFQIGTGVGEFFFLNDGTIMRAYGTNRPLYIGQTGAPDKLTLSGNDLFVAGEFEVDSTAFFDSAINKKRTTSGVGAYTVLGTDYIIGKTGITGGGDVVTLPTVASAGVGRIYIIKDESGTAGANNITIDGNGAETIDGVATIAISTNYGVARLYCSGSAWFTW